MYTVLGVIFRKLGDRERERPGPRGGGDGGCMGSSEMYFFWLFSLMDFVKKLPHVYTVLLVIFRKVGDREGGGQALGGWG